jgi:4-diphosphocytidyl-2-C-methyl-D-erythritol kinase
MQEQVFRAPAKINLFLAVNGRDTSRNLHRLTSFILPLDLCDELHIVCRNDTEMAVSGGCSYEVVVEGREASLISDQILDKVFRLWSQLYFLTGNYEIRLWKNIPLWSGLGGASSDAAVLLRFLRDVQRPALGHEELVSLALSCGSDVPFFLLPMPSIVRNFGEQIERLGSLYRDKHHRQSWLLFKPVYSVSTAEAYRYLSYRAAECYLPEAESEQRLEESLQSFMEKNPSDWLFYNSFQKFFVKEFTPIVPLLQTLRAMHYAYGMSGSGSAWFVPLAKGDDGGDVVQQIQYHLGNGTWVTKDSGWSSM